MTSEIATALLGCTRREEAALHDLTVEEGARFTGVAQRMLRRPELAQAAVADALVRIWHETADMSEPSVDWAFAVLRQSARAILRDGARLGHLGADDLGVMQQNRQYLAPGEAWRFLTAGPLRDRLETLDPPLRQSILLAHAGGFTLGEIAALSKVPLGVAEGWIASGLGALADGADCAGGFAEGRHTRMDAVLLPLDLAAPEAAPGDLWSAIAARLEPEPVALIPEPAAPMPEKPPARSRLPFVTGAVGLALGVLAMMALPSAQPASVAVLVTNDGAPQAVVEDFANGTVELRLLSDLAVPQGQVAQLWTRPSLELGPVSLGFGAGTLDAPDLPAPHAGQRYEITLEPEGGSARPTGPVVAAGVAATQP